MIRKCRTEGNRTLLAVVLDVHRVPAHFHLTALVGRVVDVSKGRSVTFTVGVQSVKQGKMSNERGRDGDVSKSAEC